MGGSNAKVNNLVKATNGVAIVLVVLTVSGLLMSWSSADYLVDAETNVFLLSGDEFAYKQCH